ncbi:MAG: hypothetical protein Q9191_004458 [Dirinaria sp. TL-2023a]
MRAKNYVCTDLKRISLNSSGLSVPAEFKVKLSVDPGKAINGKLVWRNIYEAMYEITGDDLSTPWYNTDWEIPGYYVRLSLKIPQLSKAPTPVPAQYLVWAFNYVAVSIGITSRYRNSELTAILTWKGNEVGTILVRSSAAVGRALTKPVSPMNTTSIAGNKEVPSSFLESPVNADIDVTLSYGTNPIDENVIWQTAIKATGQAAEAGLDTVSKAIVTSGINGCKWSLVTPAAPTLRYRYSRQALRSTMAKLVLDNKFQEVFVVVSQNRHLLATGGFGLAKQHAVA